MTTLGATFRPNQPPETLLDIARLADEVGLEELWLWEDCFLNGGISAAAAALAATERVRVCVGLTPVPFRNVVIQAMEVATLHRMFGDRPLIAVGHGVQEWMGQVGNRAASPLTLLREWVAVYRALLAGEEVTTKGRYVSIDHVRLDWPPLTAPPVVVGAIGPKTIQLAGEIADATILTSGASLDDVRRARAVLGAGHGLITFAETATGPTAEQRVNTPSRITGDAAAVAAGVRALVEAGATSVVLEPTADEPDLPGFLRFVAQEVRPLVD